MKSCKLQCYFKWFIYFFLFACFNNNISLTYLDSTEPKMKLPLQKIIDHILKKWMYFHL